MPAAKSNPGSAVILVLAGLCLAQACQDGGEGAQEAVVLEIVSGNDQAGEAGTVLPEPLLVQARGAGGVPVSGVSVQFEVTGGGGSLAATSGTREARGGCGERVTIDATLAATSVFTDARGEAAVTWTLGQAPVWNRVEARAAASEVLFQAWAQPGREPDPELVLQGPAGTSSEGLALWPGRGLFLGTEGGLLSVSAPGEPATAVSLTGELIERPVGIAFGAGGELYVCDNATPDTTALKAVTPAGACRTVSAGFGGNPFALPNFAAVHSSGEILLTSTCDNMIYRVSPVDGTTREFLSIPGPNGIAFDADESNLYILTENPFLFCGGADVPGGLHRVAIDPDLEPGEVETLVPDFAVAGDGLAFDNEGNLFVVFSGLLQGGLEGLLSSAIYVYTPDGRLNEFVSVGLPFDIFTNIAFGVPPFDPHSLYGYGFTGKLYRLPVGIGGRPLP